MDRKSHPNKLDYVTEAFIKDQTGKIMLTGEYNWAVIGARAVKALKENQVEITPEVLARIEFLMMQGMADYSKN